MSRPFDSEGPSGESDGEEPHSHDEDLSEPEEEEDGPTALFDLEASDEDDDDDDGHSDSDDDEEHSESDEEDTGNPFFELEASEEHNSDSDSDAGSDSDEDLGPFHPFMRLPPELRRRVWQLFCLPLETRPQVLHFTVDTWSSPSEFTDTMYLHHQTAHVRAALATHRESREYVLWALPDTLSLGRGRGVVRFNKTRDIVVLDEPALDIDCPVAGFSENVRYLALPELQLQGINIPYPASGRVLAEHASLMDSFPNVEVVYFYYEAAPAWRPIMEGTSFQNTTLEFSEPGGDGLPTKVTMDFFWPDISNDKQCAQAKEELSSNRMRSLTNSYDGWPSMSETSYADFDDMELSAAQLHRLEMLSVWPMICVDSVCTGIPPDWSTDQSITSDQVQQDDDGLIGGPSSSQVDSGEESSQSEQYESDFVVGDDNVEYDTDHGEIDEGLDELDEEPSGYYPQDSGGFGGGFSDLEPETDQDDDDHEDDDEGGLGGGAFFSYPEQELGDLDDVGEFQGFSDPEETSNDESGPARAVLPRRRRAIVISSDVESEGSQSEPEVGDDKPGAEDEDDQDAEEEGGAVRAAGSSRNRRRRVVEESDDDE